MVLNHDLGPYSVSQQLALVTHCANYALIQLERDSDVTIGIATTDTKAKPLVAMNTKDLFELDDAQATYSLDINVLPVAWMFGAVMRDSSEPIGLIGVVQVGLAAEIPPDDHCPEGQSTVVGLAQGLMDDPRASEAIIIILSCCDAGEVLTRTFYARFDRSTDPEDASVTLHSDSDGRPFLSISKTRSSHEPRTNTEADSTAYAFWEGYDGKGLKQQAPPKHGL